MKTEIFTTEDYKKLRLLEGINRPITARHVSDITQSVRKYGNQRVIITAYLKLEGFTPGYYIIDGQHLFTCLCAMNLPIVYTILPLTDNTSKSEVIEAIANFNISSKKWILEDYIRAWSSIDENYSKVQQMALYHNVPYVPLTMLAMPSALSHRSTAVTYIKKGRLKIDNPLFEIGAKYCGEILATGNASLFAKERIAIAFAIYYSIKKEHYDHSKVMQNVYNNLDKVRLLTYDTEMYSFLKESIFI